MESESEDRRLWPVTTPGQAKERGVVGGGNVCVCVCVYKGVLQCQWGRRKRADLQFLEVW